MSSRDETPTEPIPPPFVPSRSHEHRDWMTDRKRFVLWQATGVLIDDTDFKARSRLGESRMWFPPCTHHMNSQWWAKMRHAAERMEEAFRTGKGLHTQNFAEEVVLASLLGSDALTNVIDWVQHSVDAEYTALEDNGDADSDFENVLPDMADDADAELLFPNAFEVNQDGDVVNAHYATLPAVIEGVSGDLERWFDTYDYALTGA